MTTWMTIALAVALIGIVLYVGGVMWWADRRGDKLRRAGDWGGFVAVNGEQLTPSSTPTTNSAVAGLPKGNRTGFLYITPEQIDFRPLPFAFLRGSRRFRLSPEQLHRVSHAVEDVRGLFIQLKGYEGQMVLFCSHREGLQEAMERLVPNSSPGNAG